MYKTKDVKTTIVDLAMLDTILPTRCAKNVALEHFKVYHRITAMKTHVKHVHKEDINHRLAKDLVMLGGTARQVKAGNRTNAIIQNMIFNVRYAAQTGLRDGTMLLTQVGAGSLHRVLLELVWQVIMPHLLVFVKIVLCCLIPNHLVLHLVRMAKMLHVHHSRRKEQMVFVNNYGNLP